MLDAHPFEPRPNRVEFACARQAADVVEAAVAVPIPYEREAGSLASAACRLAAPCAMLGGPKARAVAAGALLALVSEAPD